MRRASLVAALVAATIVPSVAVAGNEDPLDCLLLLVDPSLRPAAWENVTAVRAWGVNGTLWALHEVNRTLADLLPPEEPDDPNTSSDPSGAPVFHPPAAGPPSAMSDQILGSLAYSVESVSEAGACLDESAGGSGSVSEIAKAVGGMLGTVLAALDPVADEVGEQEHDAECAALGLVDRAPPSCGGEGA